MSGSDLWGSVIHILFPPLWIKNNFVLTIQYCTIQNRFWFKEVGTGYIWKYILSMRFLKEKIQLSYFFNTLTTKNYRTQIKFEISDLRNLTLKNDVIHDVNIRRYWPGISKLENFAGPGQTGPLFWRNFIRPGRGQFGDFFSPGQLFW